MYYIISVHCIYVDSISRHTHLIINTFNMSMYYIGLQLHCTTLHIHILKPVVRTNWLTYTLTKCQHKCIHLHIHMHHMHKTTYSHAHSCIQTCRHKHRHPLPQTHTYRHAHDNTCIHVLFPIQSQFRVLQTRNKHADYPQDVLDSVRSCPNPSFWKVDAQNGARGRTWLMPNPHRPLQLTWNLKQKTVKSAMPPIWICFERSQR